MRIHGTNGGAFTDRRPPGRGRERKRPPPKQRTLPLADAVSRSAGPSEQFRAEVGGLDQAIREIEKAIAMVTCAREGLEKIAPLLERMETLAAPPPPPAGRGGAEGREDGSPTAEVRRLLARIDEIADSTRFGELRLLAGGLGCIGVAVGDGLSFVSASNSTRSSPPRGYEVLLRQEPIRATLLGGRPMSDEVIAAGVELALQEGGRRAGERTRRGQSPQKVIEALRGAVEAAGLALHVDLTDDRRMLVQHLRYGSAHTFTASSSLPGVLSDDRGLARTAAGQDVAGTLHGEPATGNGRTLTGNEDNPFTAGLVVRYTGLPYTGGNRNLPRSRPAILEPEVFAGRVIVAQQALTIRDPGAGAGQLVLRLDAVHASALGRGVENGSGFASLAEIRIHTPRAALDAWAVIAAAREAVAGHVTQLEALSAGGLSANLAGLRVHAQNLHAAAEQPGPVFPPLETVRALSAAIRHGGNSALNAQTRPSPSSMLELLVTEPDAGRRRGLN